MKKRFQELIRLQHFFVVKNAGTYSEKENSGGGSMGATMRFAPEKDDDANKGI